jgi:RNA polymerase sigma factor (sigma-70 family)
VKATYADGLVPIRCELRSPETQTEVSSRGYVPRLVGPDECPRDPDCDALLAQFQPLVNSLIRRYGKTPELRKDLVGEIHYQFCKLVAAYNPDRGIPICAYITHMLSQSVFNYVRDFWRRESRYVPLDGTELNDRARVPTENPCDQKLMAEEVWNALPAAIARLPHRQRLVVVWRYYDGRSFDEIAVQLGVKPATARSLLRHAIAALRRQFGPTSSIDAP